MLKLILISAGDFITLSQIGCLRFLVMVFEVAVIGADLGGRVLADKKE